MVTGQWVLDQAVSLMTSAGWNQANVWLYNYRAHHILNILGIAGARHCGKDNWKLIDSLEDEIHLDDEYCKCVLPYGLASYLLMDEDPIAACFFRQRYEEFVERWRLGRDK